VDVEVARFLGGSNFLEGRIRQGRFECPAGSFPAPGHPDTNGRPATAAIRPEDILVERPGAGGLAGRVRKASFEGASTRLWIDCGGTDIVALTARADLHPGQAVDVHLPAEKIRIFPHGTRPE
jgi:ABC-type Fe3+/spermidine/putrescine transport system ATPase subunit